MLHHLEAILVQVVCGKHTTACRSQVPRHARCQAAASADQTRPTSRPLLEFAYGPQAHVAATKSTRGRPPPRSHLTPGLITRACDHRRRENKHLPHMPLACRSLLHPPACHHLLLPAALVLVSSRGCKDLDALQSAAGRLTTNSTRDDEPLRLFHH